ncbi:unnamed protein product [Malus baccata var. baccata]
MGGLMRDFAGLRQAAGGKAGLVFNNTAMAEVAVICVALMVCIEMDCDKVEIESDSQVIISMLNREYVVDATLECLIHDIGHLASQLGSVRFLFVKRNGNAVAHAVASYVASHGSSFHWDAFGPEF